MRKNKFFILFLSCIMAFSLAGCGKKLKSTEDLIAKARKEIKIADAIEVQLAAKYTKNEETLMWFITGNEYQTHRYVPIIFENVGEEEYVFVQRHNSMDRGQDIGVYNWGDGYSFLVNNPKCKKIQITGNVGGSGTVTEVEIGEGEYPFHYYYELMQQEYVFEYLFFDGEGNEIR